MSKVTIYSAAIASGLFVLETVLREVGVSVTYRPTNAIYKVGLFVSDSYYAIGRLFGWIWYYIVEIYNFIRNNFLIAIEKTFIDFRDALLPYFRFGEFFKGIRSVLMEYWEWAKDSTIAMTVFITIALVIIVAIMAYFSFKVTVTSEKEEREVLHERSVGEVTIKKNRRRD